MRETLAANKQERLQKDLVHEISLDLLIVARGLANAVERSAQVFDGTFRPQRSDDFLSGLVGRVSGVLILKHRRRLHGGENGRERGRNRLFDSLIIA